MLNLSSLLSRYISVARSSVALAMRPLLAVYHVSCPIRMAARVGKMRWRAAVVGPVAHSALMASSVVSLSPKSRISSSTDQGR